MLQGIKETNYLFKGQTQKYTGKVRDVYAVGDVLILVATDRISAFDVVLPEPIPYKGQVLNQIAAYFLHATSHIVPNWLLAVPDACVSIGRPCIPFKVEMVVRGYLAGHAWREYQSGKREICGVSLPEGLQENDRLPTPILTPTTKASEGHDQDISRQEILASKIVSLEDYETIESYALELFNKGSEMAHNQGLILVDTKYEFGRFNNQIMLIDEIHTPDSSRYFYADTYEELQSNGLPQRQLSKEFVRKWLIENGFQGKEGQIVPSMTPEFIQSVSDRYIELYEKITGQKFVPAESSNPTERIKHNIEKYLTK